MKGDGDENKAGLVFQHLFFLTEVATVQVRTLPPLVLHLSFNTFSS